MYVCMYVCVCIAGTRSGGHGQKDSRQRTRRGENGLLSLREHYAGIPAGTGAILSGRRKTRCPKANHFGKEQILGRPQDQAQVRTCIAFTQTIIDTNHAKYIYIYSY